MKIFAILFLSFSFAFGVAIGKVPPTVTLSGEDGGRVDESTWSSSMIQGKVYVVFYVDPDKKDLNEALADALRVKKFDRKNYGSIAIINMAATWLPNIAFESKLKEKQQKFPNTIYVKDKNKVLVKAWNIADDNSDILLFDKSGRLLFEKSGKLDQDEIKKVIELIEANIQ